MRVAWPLGVDGDSLGRLLPGDLAAILLFVAAGEVRHHLPPWEYQMRYVRVLLPFLLGWAVAALLLGAYDERVRASPLAAALFAVGAWVAAAAVAVVLRGTAAFPGSADPVFYLVSVAFGGSLLAVWRLVRVGVVPRISYG
jgi:hypothetical protein